MKNLALLFAIVVLASGICIAQTSAFTYQGKLGNSGSPASGTYQFEFKLFPEDIAGTQIGSTQTVVATVQNGVFTTRLDFGVAAFPGDASRWLEISVRLNGSGDPYTVLSPRQEIDSVPFAVHSRRATTADNADNAQNLDGVAANQYVKTDDSRLTDARPPTSNSPHYIQNSNDEQDGDFNITGNGVIRGRLKAGSLHGDGAAVFNVPGTFSWQVVTSTSQQAQPNTGYVANSASEVMITLPTAPNVGDIVRVSGAGVGGWRIAQNPGQSIMLVGIELGWTPHESERNWVSVASSADGSKLVAATQLNIYTSSDSGTSWTPHFVEGTATFFAVASSHDGNKLVAVGRQIYTSTDSGLSWVLRVNTGSWDSVASSSDGTKLVVVPSVGQIHTSINSGETWTPQAVSSPRWADVASSDDGTKLVALVRRSHLAGHIYTSTDSGVSWTSRPGDQYWRSVASSADGSKLVAVGSDSEIYTSTDSGVSWTPREVVRAWSSVASSADGSRLVAVVSGGQIYTSTDSGASWSPREQNRAWSSVASSADGDYLVATGGRIYTSNMRSTLGGTGSITSGALGAIELQYIGGGRFLTLSHEGMFIVN